MFKTLRNWIGLASHEDKVKFILRLLYDEEGWASGLDMVGAPQSPLRRGTVYLTLAYMEDAGWIRCRTVDDTYGRRRVYIITIQGIAQLMGYHVGV